MFKAVCSDAAVCSGVVYGPVEELHLYTATHMQVIAKCIIVEIWQELAELMLPLQLVNRQLPGEVLLCSTPETVCTGDKVISCKHSLTLTIMRCAITCM